MGKRQQIMDAVATRMAAILTTGGYVTNAGSHVHEWRPRLANGDYVPFGPGELPAILLQDRKCETSVMDFEMHEHRLSVEIEGRCQGGTTNGDLLRSLSDDIRRAIGVDSTWSGLALDTEPSTDEFALVQADQTFGGVLVTITIIYQTSPWGAS